MVKLFLDMALCSFVGRLQQQPAASNFRLPSTKDMKIAGSSEMLASIYKFRQCHNPEDRRVNITVRI
jgi:hypothetical protein